MSRGRPKKYHSDNQRLKAKKANNKKIKRVIGRYFRLVVPALAEYGTNWTHNDSRIVKLRQTVVDTLVARECKRSLSDYLVAVERHPGSGLPHLDILLIYANRIYNTSKTYDYVLKHGDLTRYRTVNAAILDYGRKQDPNPLGNLNTAAVIAKSRVKTDLYEMMQAAMLKRPFEFDPIDWLAKNKLMISAVKTNMYKAIRAVKDLQNNVCNKHLINKPGFRVITPELIQSHLSTDQLELFRSWPGYQVIVDHINQIPRYGCHRPHKTRNLLVVGRPNTGKTRLALEIERCTAVYYKDVSNWFPAYRPQVYKMVLWNEFTLRGLAYPKLLNYLEGAKMDLQYKGGSVLKTDNQLVYMTSNMRLNAHICARFSSEQNRKLARANLGARITEVVIPAHLDLFILLKLIVPVPAAAFVLSRH